MGTPEQQVVRLEPHSLRLGYFQSDFKAEDYVIRTFRSHAQNVITEFFGKDRPFAPEEINAAIVEAASGDADTILRETFRRHLALRPDWGSFDGESLLTRIEGPLDDLDPSTLVLPDGFKKRLRIEAHSRKDFDDFSNLSRIHRETLLQTDIPEFIRNISEMYSGDTLCADDLFHYCREAYETMNIAIPAEKIEQAYFLAYLKDIRYPVQDTVFAASTTNIIKGVRDLYIGKPEEDFLSLLVEHSKLEAFVTGHWDTIFHCGNPSEAVLQELVEIELSRTEMMAQIVRRLPDGNNQHALSMVKAALDDSYERIFEEAGKNGTKAWMTIDRGHFLGNFVSHNICELSYIPETNREPLAANPVKNGKQVVIFEDDAAFCERAMRLIEAHTSYSFPTDGNGICVRPEQFREWFDDSSVGLYVLDIQNFDDATAGIRLARELVKHKVKSLKKLNPEELSAASRTNILIWTSSPELRILAEKDLGHLKYELKSASDLINSPSQYGSAPIDIKVYNKSFLLDSTLNSYAE